jgi:hypothetical protein
MKWQDPRDQPAGHPSHVCESCKRERASEVLARPESQLRIARLTSKPVAPSVALCHSCWLNILWGLKPIPREP